MSLEREMASAPSCLINFYESPGDAVQYEVMKTSPSVWDEKMERKEPLLFGGDDDGFGNELRPPLAWTIIWRNRHSSLYGMFMTRKTQSWGYVMWDKARLQRSGADVMLSRFWEDEVSDSQYDLREDLDHFRDWE
jgi:hypothetical protein